MFFLKDIPGSEVLETDAEKHPEMNIDPTAVCACLNMLRTGSDMLAGFETMLRGHNLSQGRFLVMLVMHGQGGGSVLPSELSEKVGVARATMTGLLDGLERDALIRREADKEDGRKSRVRLTPAGAALMESVLPDYYRRIGLLMKGLSGLEREMVVFLLEKVHEQLPSLTE
ncbi:MAG TPA: MarR family transcriptional regulator [bacterium]|nr:MarR family transcriptional regulator [bacterium]